MTSLRGRLWMTVPWYAFHAHHSAQLVFSLQQNLQLVLETQFSPMHVVYYQCTVVGLSCQDHGQTSRTKAPTTDGCVCLRLGFAFSDPGRHLVIAVGDVILGNVVGGSVPDAVVAEDVTQSLVEMLRSIRTPDIVRMK